MTTTFRFSLLTGIVFVALTGITFAQNANEAQVEPKARTRFETVNVYLDSGDDALAAFQVEVTAERGRIKIVGVEAGEVPALAGDRFYYDRQAIDAGRSDRVIVAAFSTAKPDELPTGRKRVATLHVYVEGGAAEYVARVTAAANHEGEKIKPKVTAEKGTD